MSDIDKELADLEAEIDDEENPEKKDRQKKQSEAKKKIELEDLEAEIDDEENAEKKERQKKQSEAKKKIEKAKESDPYPNRAEEKYHNIETMISLEVLAKEKEICDLIIQYKKNIGLNDDEWVKKKNFIDIRIQFISTLLNNSKVDCELYKMMLKEQIKSEERYLKLSKNKRLTDAQNKVVIDRINNRKKIIENELNENLDIKFKINDLATEVIPSNDLYPINIENKYHKMSLLYSLGVLEKEKDLCDKIIEYKKGLLLDYGLWEKKKKDIDERIQTITKLVEGGNMDLDGYKSLIKLEKKWEEKYLELAEKEINLTEEQKEIIIKRINERKNKRENELNKNIEDGNEEDEKE